MHRVPGKKATDLQEERKFCILRGIEAVVKSAGLARPFHFRTTLPIALTTDKWLGASVALLKKTRIRQSKRCSGTKERSMTSRPKERKTKKVLPLGWVNEKSFPVRALVRVATKPRGPAHHVLFTPAGSSDTTVEVRRP